MFVLSTFRNYDLQKISTNTEIICSNGTNKTNMKSNYKPSGIVVLLFATLERNHEHNKTLSPWNLELYSNLMTCKPNIIKKNQNTSNHVNSKGVITSFGNKGLYGKSS